MTDENLKLCRQALREHYRESIRNLNMGEDVVPAVDVARACRQVADLVLVRLGVDAGPVPETYAAWLLTDKPEGEAA